jgi:hypothetical protein
MRHLLRLCRDGSFCGAQESSRALKRDIEELRTGRNYRDNCEANYRPEDVSDLPHVH